MCTASNDRRFWARPLTARAAGRFSESELLAAIDSHTGVLHRVRLLGEPNGAARRLRHRRDDRCQDEYTISTRRVATLATVLPPNGLAPSNSSSPSSRCCTTSRCRAGSILNKPGRLTVEEFAEMRKHPVHGARILANIKSPLVSAVLPGVQYHHEKWDGSGYPDGLSGDGIPLLGRLLGVADFLDALTSARAYHPAMSPTRS
jgi:hypothetical protein